MVGGTLMFVPGLPKLARHSLLKNSVRKLARSLLVVWVLLKAGTSQANRPGVKSGYRPLMLKVKGAGMAKA